MFPLLYITLFTVFATQVSAQNRVAVAHLMTGNINGSVLFTETAQGLHVTGSITGLPEGRYGFHVHALGDVSTCNAAGPHFNPDGDRHGGRDHSVRHVGDLGNVVFVGNENAVATLDFVDNIITLRGRNNILGRTLVLHEQEDDLGLGNHELSHISGNAGPRAACGVIGIVSPSEPWNSAGTITTPRLSLFALSLIFVYVRL
ncbi:superoxide dismutase [Cu-Zn]-like [Manduca sexta]|uniref:superoxide dismutase [Cu-Zn]-like n=1 Tax=Manduca sexta TaxID=7130 RepID=UPI0011842030|nr:superoxide dismutase [Cu-Zn]-like [Manduca sexta]